MKLKLMVVFLCVFSFLFAQEKNTNFFGLQFGGQAIVGLTYERNVLKKENLSGNITLGGVINEYADDQLPDDRPIYGLNLGFVGLYNFKIVQLDIEFYTSPYFYKNYTFVNYYSWVGLRYVSKGPAGGYLSIGYTPSLYFSKSPPSHFNHFKIGLKTGFFFNKK